MTETSELLPCPFCGSKNVRASTNLVECRNPNCGATGPDLGHFVEPAPYPQATAAWNTRAASASPVVSDGNTKRNVYVESADYTVETTIEAAIAEMEDMRRQGWDPRTEAHFMLAQDALQAALTEAPAGEADWLTCTECHKPIDPSDETIMGEAPMHKACADKWGERFAADIAGRGMRLTSIERQALERLAERDREGMCIMVCEPHLCGAIRTLTLIEPSFFLSATPVPGGGWIAEISPAGRAALSEEKK